MNTLGMKELQFQKLNFDGLQTLVKWAEQEGWNPGLHDAEVFWATDPDGYWGFYYDGNLIAGGSIVAYGNEFGFMGFFIVKPEFRSFGVGRQLWYKRRDTLLRRLKEDAPIGMDGVVTMQPFYNKGGFRVAFRDERFMRTGTSFIPDPKISAIETQDFDSIIEYDKYCFGAYRPQFLIPWLSQPEINTFKYIHNGKLSGFAITRKCVDGYKICPLFADRADIAESLYRACLNAAIGQPVFLDIPVVNPDAVSLVKKYEATYVFECARMYYSNPPEIAINKVFGITTFELG